MSEKDKGEMHNVRLDEDGFMVDPHEWSSDLAERFARHAGLEGLTEDHWRVIGHVRNHFLNEGTLPVMRLICEEVDLEPHCVNRLFGTDVKTLWRIAGLPNPGEEAKTYM